MSLPNLVRLARRVPPPHPLGRRALAAAAAAASKPTSASALAAPATATGSRRSGKTGTLPRPSPPPAYVPAAPAAAPSATNTPASTAAHARQAARRAARAAAATFSSPPLPLDAALDAVAAHAFGRYDEGVRLCLRLGIDARVAAQSVRSSVMLPHPVRAVPPRVGVFVAEEDGPVAAAATAAGADIVGDARLAASLGATKGRGFAKGTGAVDVTLAETVVAGNVARSAGKALGTRGLLPLAKQGTLFDGPDGAAAAVEAAKSGRWVFFRNDEGGNLAMRVGRVVDIRGGGDEEGGEAVASSKVRANVLAAVGAVMAAKPAVIKKKFVVAATLSSDMGPGVPVLVEDLMAALDEGRGAT